MFDSLVFLLFDLKLVEIISLTAMIWNLDWACRAYLPLTCLLSLHSKIIHVLTAAYMLLSTVIFFDYVVNSSSCYLLLCYRIYRLLSWTSLPGFNQMSKSESFAAALALWWLLDRREGSRRLLKAYAGGSFLPAVAELPTEASEGSPNLPPPPPVGPSGLATSCW